MLNDEKVTIENYTEHCLKTWGGDHQIERAELGIIGELGEVAEVLKKFLRGDFDDVERDKRLLKEFGDLLYYCAIKEFLFDDTECFVQFLSRSEENIKKKLIHQLEDACELKCVIQGVGTPYYQPIVNIITKYGFTVEQVMEANIEKLTCRAKRNKIKGDGDDR